MKTYLIVLVTCTLPLLTQAQHNPSRKAKKDAKKALILKETTLLINSKNWQFNASEMLPLSGQSQHLNTPYYVTITDTLTDVYLPYFGRAYTAPYAGNESPMTFEAVIDAYQLTSKKDDSWMVKFKTRNNTDILTFTFTVYTNGSATLYVNSVNRQPITYNGNITAPTQ